MPKQSKFRTLSKQQIIVILIVVLFFLGLSVFLSFMLPFWFGEGFSQTTLFLVTFLASLFGGLCTLIGVTLTIRFEESSREKAFVESCKPEFFAPIQYDLAKGISCRFLSIQEPEDVVSNKMICLQNSDKTSFYVDCILCRGKRFEPVAPIYVEKGRLLLIHLYNKDSLCDAVLYTRGMDERPYCFRLVFVGEELIGFEEVEHVCN